MTQELLKVLSDGDYINGELDLVIRDGNGFSLWDIKSASRFAFEKKWFFS